LTSKTQVIPSKIGEKSSSKKVSNILKLKLIEISKYYHFGKILGIGTFGLIREAVRVPMSRK
jgi:hypothetical protein